ncbi:histidinol-phosphatase [Pseudooceanicola sp. C21-150M6]|uniref:histidinol-phosphatase n=1 Tax=Pseudooceanicola sp. C21-150M6 TaxID=3434355 RepID=UPI003D7F5E25
MDIEDITQTAHEMADAARAAILPYFRTRSLAADNKLETGFDPVTQADLSAEKAIRAVLARRRPLDGVLGEEFGTSEGSSGLTWVIDPIDGTRGFISGTPTWGVLIALSDQKGPIFGLIDQPYIGERFEGGFGRASCAGPQGATELRTSGVTDLEYATLFTTFPEVGTTRERDGFAAVASEVRLVRYGMDCYAYALLAGGHVDLVIEAGLNAYDIQAPIAVVQAAGGIVTDWSGNPVHQGGRCVAAANAELHAAALERLQRFT